MILIPLPEGLDFPAVGPVAAAMAAVAKEVHAGAVLVAVGRPAAVLAEAGKPWNGMRMEVIDIWNAV